MVTKADIHPLVLTHDGFTLTRADGVANAMSDIWKYQVPRGTELYISPGDVFSVHLRTSSAEVGNLNTQVKVEARNSAGSEVSNVLGPEMYVALKDFQDRDLIYRIRLMEQIRIPSRYFLTISAVHSSVIVEANSRFTLSIHQSYVGVS